MLLTNLSSEETQAQAVLWSGASRVYVSHPFLVFEFNDGPLKPQVLFNLGESTWAPEEGLEVLCKSLKEWEWVKPFTTRT